MDPGGILTSGPAMVFICNNCSFLETDVDRDPSVVSIVCDYVFGDCRVIEGRDLVNLLSDIILTPSWCPLKHLVQAYKE